MHTAPNPGPPIAKVHDISFEKDKTLMRTISTEGAGTEAREGAVVTIHLTISQPGEDGELYEIYRSKDTHPTGLKFELGRSAYSEAVERAVAGNIPVFISFVTRFLLSLTFGSG